MTQVYEQASGAMNPRQWWNQGGGVPDNFAYQQAQTQQAFAPLANIGQDISTNAAFANSLSSENMRALYPAQAQVQLGQLQYQTEIARQNAINQRIGPLLQLLAGAFGHLSGGQSGFSGFQSNFGQGAGAPAPAAAPSPH